MQFMPVLKKTLCGLLVALVVFGISATSYAKSDIWITEGVVDLDRDGTVIVWIRAEDEPEAVVPSNGGGLFRAGQIFPGDIVTVKINGNPKKQTHRGHVTVLK